MNRTHPLARYLRPAFERLARPLARFAARTATRRTAAGATAIEPLEARRLFSAAVLGGAVDATFGQAGLAALDVAGNFDLARAVAVQGDGRVLIAGQADGPGGRHAFVARLNADGTPDATFGAGGVVELPSQAGWGGTFVEHFTSIVVQADGKIVAGGVALSGAWASAADPLGTAFAAVRFNADGTLDSGFGTAGVATANFAGADALARVVVAPGGKVVAVGTTGAPFAADTGDFAVARWLADGTADATFDGDGQVTLNFTAGGAGVDYATAVAVRADGRIVVAGSVVNLVGPTIERGMAVVRLRASGTPDATFGTGGAVYVAGDVAPTDVLLDGTGVLVAGATGRSVFVSRFAAGGALDPSFGEGGTATFDADNTAWPAAYRLRRLAAGGGYAVVGPAVRHDADAPNPDHLAGSVFVATVDASGAWTAAGSVTVAGPAANLLAADVAPDGRVVAAGALLGTTTGYAAADHAAVVAGVDFGTALVPAEEELLVAVEEEPEPAPLPAPAPPPVSTPDAGPTPSPAPQPEPQPATPDGPEVRAQLLGKTLVKGGRTYSFKVLFSSGEPIAPATLQAMHVTGPNDFDSAAALLKAKASSGGTRVLASYRIAAPGGAFDAGDNGTYALAATRGNVLPAAGITPRSLTVGDERAGVIGEFRVSAKPVGGAPKVASSGAAGEQAGESKEGDESVAQSVLRAA